MPASAQTATTPVGGFSQGGGARDIDRGASEAQGTGTGTATAGCSHAGLRQGTTRHHRARATDGVGNLATLSPA